MKAIETRKITKDIPPIKVICFSCKEILYRKRDSFVVFEKTNGFEVFCCKICFDTEENIKFKFMKLN